MGKIHLIERPLIAQIGDLVTASLIGLKEARRGVYIKDNGDGTVIVKGQLEDYICKGPDSLVVVPDEHVLRLADKDIIITMNYFRNSIK